MNPQIGQVWEDKDPRRVGRTFKIINIDDDIATCQNITGVNNKTSFINVKRLKSSHYKLKDNGITTFSTLTSDEVAPIQRIFDNILVIRRPSKAALVQECKNLWPGEWREAGPYIMLNSENNDFEISIRQRDEFNKPFEAKVKLYNFYIHDVVAADIQQVIRKIQDYFLVLNYELQRLIKGDIK